MLNLVFLLDITGSMSCELDGVKETVKRLVKTAFVDHEGELMATIVTFTEDHKDCYVTSHSFTDGERAMRFVSNIALCTPPGSPGVNANGGDGPENHKAALAAMLQLDKNLPTVAFLITDAIPHLRGTRSTEADHEIRYLSQTHGITDSDLFAVLARLDAHFGGNLVLSAVKYYKNRDHKLYGAVAKRFNGVLVTPTVRNADALATGLMAIFAQILRALTGVVAPQEAADEQEVATATRSALAAFSFFDLAAVEIPATEGGCAAIAAPTVGSTDELLFRLVERTAVIAGDRFKKRAITALLVSEQVELLRVLAKGMLRAVPVPDALTRATKLLDTIAERMEDEHRSQFKLDADALRVLLDSDTFVDALTDDELSVAASAITLLSVDETARDVAFDETEAEAEADPYEALLSVASLFLGHLCVLELPTRMGTVDFMDAWSATIPKVSSDVVSAADFLRLIGDAESVAGLSARDREFNFVQLVADPRDALGSALLRVASGTQVLDILTALLAGAPAGLFSPNMFRGTLAACLTTLLAGKRGEDALAPLSEFEWGVVRKMVHTLRLLMGVTPRELHLEPESAMGKLLFRLLRVTASVRVDERELRAFLEEMAAARVQKFAKYNPASYHALVEKVVGYEHAQHALVDVLVPHPLVDDDAWTFDGAHAARVVAQSTFCKAFERCAANVIAAAHLPDDEHAAPSLQQVWPEYALALPKLLLLEKRTERYTLTEEEKPVAVTSANKTDGKSDDKSVTTADAAVTVPSKVWVRNDVMQSDLSASHVFRVCAMRSLRAKYDTFVRDVRARRADVVKAQQWSCVLELMRAPLAQFVSQLSVVVYSSGRREHMLLLKAFALHGHAELPPREYEAKLIAVLTGRVLEGATDRIVFNRGNLHPHPDRVVPLSPAFAARLRGLQRARKWSLAHRYRESGTPNHSGHSNANPSTWAAKRTTEKCSFWDAEDAATAA